LLNVGEQTVAMSAERQLHSCELWESGSPALVHIPLRQRAGSSSSLVEMHGQWPWLSGTVAFCSWKRAPSKGVIVHPYPL
jgi:hypothetical protein